MKMKVGQKYKVKSGLIIGQFLSCTEDGAYHFIPTWDTSKVWCRSYKEELKEITISIGGNEKKFYETN
jgi:hypothetical protein